MSRSRSTGLRLLASFTAAALMVPNPGTAQTLQRKVHPMIMQNDLANRSPDIHWPAGFDPAKADLFAHNEVIINASCDRVWGHIIDATAWPNWYPNSHDIHLSDAGATVLGPDATFTWKTFGQDLESRIHEFVPGSRIGWFGGSHGEVPGFYHTFYLIPRGETCHVITEEMGNGPGAQYARKADEGMLHRGHDLWLATLKWVSEK